MGCAAAVVVMMLMAAVKKVATETTVKQHLCSIGFESVLSVLGDGPAP